MTTSVEKIREIEPEKTLGDFRTPQIDSAIHHWPTAYNIHDGTSGVNIR